MPALRGRTALVTGASAGIGREIARVLAAREVAVLVLVARRRERLDELAQELTSARPGLRVLVRAVDLLDRRATGEMLDELERAQGLFVDLLVNNAGFGVWGAFERSDWERLEAMLELNVVSATYLLHRLLPAMVARGSGAVMNVGSSAGMLAQPGFAGYGATKAYLNHLNEALAAELAGTGVTLTVVCPGPVPTEFQEVAQTVGRRKDYPSVVKVTAEAVAEESVRALERGQVRVIPGLPMKAAVLSLEALPKVAVRPFLRRVGRRLRGG